MSTNEEKIRARAELNSRWKRRTCREHVLTTRTQAISCVGRERKKRESDENNLHSPRPDTTTAVPHPATVLQAVLLLGGVAHPIFIEEGHRADEALPFTIRTSVRRRHTPDSRTGRSCSTSQNHPPTHLRMRALLAPIPHFRRLLIPEKTAKPPQNPNSFARLLHRQVPQKRSRRSRVSPFTITSNPV